MRNTNYHSCVRSRGSMTCIIGALWLLRCIFQNCDFVMFKTSGLIGKRFVRLKDVCEQCCDDKDMCNADLCNGELFYHYNVYDLMLLIKVYFSYFQVLHF